MRFKDKINKTLDGFSAATWILLSILLMMPFICIVSWWMYTIPGLFSLMPFVLGVTSIVVAFAFGLSIIYAVVTT